MEVRATAARLIREHGYSSATMDLLADEVGLNKGTLYHYYPSKSAILYELLSDQVDATLDFLAKVPAEGTPTERFRELVRLQIEHVSNTHDELLVFFQELPWVDKHLPADQATSIRRRVQRYERFTRRLLADGVRSGEFRDLDANMIMYAMIGILGYVPTWFRGTSRKSHDALIDELTAFVMNGVLAHR